MKIVRTEYRRQGEGFSPVRFATRVEIEEAGYYPVAAQEPVTLPHRERIWLFETASGNNGLRRTWFGELRAGCSSCLAPEEYHTGSSHIIGATLHEQGHVVCRAFR